MPLIRPISDLRNKTPEIAKLCHRSGEPVFITKNGESDLVVMSVAAYERDQARLKLYESLAAAEEDVRHGDRGVTLKRLTALLRLFQSPSFPSARLQNPAWAAPL